MERKKTCLIIAVLVPIAVIVYLCADVSNLIIFEQLFDNEKALKEEVIKKELEKLEILKTLEK